MKAELRPYQVEWVDRVNAGLRAKDAARVMAQLPTGGGKTTCAAAVIEGWQQENPDARIFWLTHRKELIDQSADRLAAEGIPALPAHARIWKPGQPTPMTGQVVVAGPEVLARRRAMADSKPGDLLVLDEAHHSAAPVWTGIIKDCKGAVLGLTATPWRLSKKEGFDHLYGDLIAGPQVADLIDEGSLSRFRLFSTPKSKEIGGRAADLGKDGDFEVGKVERRLSREILLDNAFEHWVRYGGSGKQTLVYALTVRHAGNITDLWSERGYSAALLTSKTPAAERDEVMRRYRSGELQTLVNVGIATEGFDIPAIGCVMILRPTASLALYQQMMGRGLRPNENGEPTLLLDLTDNPERFGRPDRKREWSLEPRGDSNADIGDAVTKTCWAGADGGEPCLAVNAASAHACEACGAPFGMECGVCGRFRSWKDWTPGLDRCGLCMDGVSHQHLEYLDPWRLAYSGHDFRTLGNNRLLAVFGWGKRHLERPWVSLVEGGKVVDRLYLPDIDLRDPDAQWRYRQAGEIWQGVDDRPPLAVDLFRAAQAAYKAGDAPKAAGLLTECRAAHGAERAMERIENALKICLAQGVDKAA